MLWQCGTHAFTFPRPPLVMGIVNVTPDSFSDGGRFESPEAAIAHGLRLVEEGADILDIGGESSRPGSQPVAADEELRRVLPVVAALARQTKIPLSIDTTKAEVARRCLDVGTHIVNDITAATGDPAMVETVARHRAGLVLMHMQGTPATMQANPTYADVVTEIREYLEVRFEQVCERGVPVECVAVDPGIGFGKTLLHNLELLSHLDRFQTLRRPVCLGVSRKGIIGQIIGRPRMERIAGGLACAAHAMAHKAVQILRVHDVAPTKDFVRMFAALDDPDRAVVIQS
jgi:dihydropteroate synthase